MEGYKGEDGGHRLRIRTADGLDDVSACIMIRAAVYIGEFGLRVRDESDGNDFCATHVLAEVDGEPAGTMRIRYYGGFALLERMAVLKPYRRRRVDRKLVAREVGTFAVHHCRTKGFERFAGAALDGLVDFWRKFAPEGGDFSPVPGMATTYGGFPIHVMEGQAPPLPGAVTSPRQHDLIRMKESSLAGAPR